MRGEVDEEMDDDAQPAAAGDAIPQTPQVSLTFLLVSGRRRTMSFEPETTVGRVKELVWNAWPSGESSHRFFVIARVFHGGERCDPPVFS